MDPAAELLVLRAAGLDVLEIARLARLRVLIAAGKVSEQTPESRRLEYVRWMVEHGRLNGDHGALADR